MYCQTLSGITVLFGLTAPQHFILLVHTSSHNAEDELSMYNMCATFLVLAVSLVTVASVPLIDRGASFLPLPKHTVILYVGLYLLAPNRLQF
jgi:hypothetical protein